MLLNISQHFSMIMMLCTTHLRMKILTWIEELNLAYTISLKLENAPDEVTGYNLDEKKNGRPNVYTARSAPSEKKKTDVEQMKTESDVYFAYTCKTDRCWILGRYEQYQERTGDSPTCSRYCFQRHGFRKPISKRCGFQNQQEGH